MLVQYTCGVGTTASTAGLMKEEVGDIEGDAPSSKRLRLASSDTLQDIASGEELSKTTETVYDGMKGVEMDEVDGDGDSAVNDVPALGMQDKVIAATVLKMALPIDFIGDFEIHLL